MTGVSMGKSGQEQEPRKGWIEGFLWVAAQGQSRPPRDFGQGRSWLGVRVRWRGGRGADSASLGWQVKVG